MGHALRKEGIIARLQIVTNRLIAEAYVIEQVASLSAEDLVNCINFLNQIAESFGDFTGKRLAFVLNGEPDGTVMWRNNIKIKCYKVSCSTGVIESTYLLTMKDFVHIYNEMTSRAASISKVSQNVINSISDDSNISCLEASLILNGFDNFVASKEEQELDECMICMDQQAKIILPCMHNFCEICINSWQRLHNTCPTCRTPLNRPEDSWVLSEFPTDAEMAAESNNYVLGLIDKHPTVDIND